MTRPFNTMKGGVKWAQPPTTSSTLEIDIPFESLCFDDADIATPTELFRKNLSITVSECGRILSVSYCPTPEEENEEEKAATTAEAGEEEVMGETPPPSTNSNTIIWETQLYAPVKRDSSNLSWYVRSKADIVLELTKQIDNRWEELLCIPIDKDGEDGDYYLPMEELDDAAAKIFPPLPSSSSTGGNGNDGEEESAKKAPTPDESLPQKIQESQTRELLRYQTEHDACCGRLVELNQQLEALEQNAEEGSEEQVKHLKNSLNMTKRLLEIVSEIRTLRTSSTPTTIEAVLKYQQLEVLKGRVNIGENNMEEIEEYGSSEEEAMSGIELFLSAVTILRSQTAPSEAVRLLRVAATKKGNSQAAITLLAIYKEAPMSFVRGVTALLKIALDESNGSLDARANHYIGNLFNDGTRFFPQNWAVAVHFYQRAASAGSAASMRCLWELLHNGECANHGSGDAEVPSYTFPSPLRSTFFLQASVERGNVAAFVVNAKQLAMGSEDVEPDLIGARASLDAARAAEPLIARSGDFRAVDSFIKSKEEETATQVKPVEVASTVEPTPVAASSTQDKVVPSTVVDDSDDIIEMPLPKKSTAQQQTASTVPSPMSLTQPNSGNGGPQKLSAADRLARYVEEFGGVKVDDLQEDGSTRMMTTTKSNTGMFPRGNPTPAGRRHVGEGEKSKQFWERTAKAGVVFGAVYFFAFPIRAMFLPAFYAAIQGFFELFGLASPSHDLL